MAMTLLLCWSLFVECMKRMLCCRASIFVVGWMYYGPGVMLTLDDQIVRLYCLLLVTRSASLLMFDAVGPIMRQHHVNVLSCAIWLSKYNTTMLITAVHRSSLVECIMDRVSCWPLCCPNDTLQWWCQLCNDLHSLNVLNGWHVGRGRAACTFAAIDACTIDLTRRCYCCLMR